MKTSLVHPQLPLGFEPGELYTFDSFVPGQNAVACGLTRQFCAGKGEQQLYFWGNAGSGKSHLLQASCNLAAKNGQTVCYLTQQELEGQSPDIFDGLENIELICLDEIGRWLLNDDWETALFDLINRVREKNHRLLLASTQPPDEMDIDLADLRSRLAWGPVFHLYELNDKDKFQALRYRASLNGLELPEKVADYLMQRFPRDMFSLFEKLAVLDKASMATKRRLTIPLVKSVFDVESGQ